MNKPVPKLPISSARSRVAAIKGAAYMPASGAFLMCTRDPDICLPICPKAKWRLVTRVLGLGQMKQPAWRERLFRTLIVDSRGVDLTMSYNPIFVMISSLKPLFFNGLKNAQRFLDNMEGEDPGIQ